MSCRLISTSKGYEIVCEFLHVATFQVYFYAQNGSQKRVVNCILFNELYCFNDPGFVYEKHVSSAVYIAIPLTFEWTPGKFVCRMEESRAENTTSCDWPPKNTEVPQNVFIEGASLTSPDRILTNVGIGLTLVIGVLLFFGLLYFVCCKKKTKILDTIARIRNLVRRIYNKENLKKTTIEDRENTIPLNCGESKACPTNQHFSKGSGDKEIQKDRISDSVTVGEVGEFV